MFDHLSADILASLIKGFPRTRTTTRTTTKQNVDPTVHCVYSRVKIHVWEVANIMGRGVWSIFVVVKKGPWLIGFIILATFFVKRGQSHE
jgi:hypothetical protein